MFWPIDSEPAVRKDVPIFPEDAPGLRPSGDATGKTAGSHGAVPASGTIMQVRIKCFATLSDHTPEGGVLALPAGGTVENALAAIGLAPEDVKLVFVNSKHAEMDAPLADGDQLGIFPAVGGG